MTSFTELNLPPHILKAVTDLGYTEPTAIQAQTIPLILSGKDVIGQSQTGSGKTAAFGLPILSTLQKGKGVQALILTPTRELCVQVSDALKGFGKNTQLSVLAVYGGVGIGPQLGAMKYADIVVATPGRLLDLIERGVKISTVKYLVLDEADRMLDMGFIDDVEKIIRNTPKQRQTVLFSATLNQRLQGLVHKYMNNPQTVKTKVHVDTSLLTERVFLIKQEDKFSLLVHFLKNETPGIAIVFCATRHGCDKLARKLRTQNIDATPIHGGLPQAKRIRTINTLHERGEGILVATDVASRGLHIDNISHIYNFDLPNVSDDYVHRIGRTARAGEKGDAITFVTSQDVRDFKIIMRDTHRDLKATELPTFEKLVVPDMKGGNERFGRGQRGGGHRSFGGGRRHGGGDGPRTERRGEGEGRSSGQGGKRPFWKKNKRPGQRPQHGNADR